jgi:hypothetical protein
VTDAIRIHPIQAVEVRVDRISAGRRPRPADTEITPTSNLPKVRLVSLADDGRSFSIEVRVRVSVPLVDDQAWDADLRIDAKFLSEVKITRPIARAFTDASGVFLVWPFARSYLSELARMSDVPAPFLPLVWRPQGT